MNVKKVNATKQSLFCIVTELTLTRPNLARNLFRTKKGNMSPTPSPRPLQFFPIHCGLERKSSPTVRSGASPDYEKRCESHDWHRHSLQTSKSINYVEKALNSCRDEERVVLQQVPVLCPHPLVHHIAKVRSLLRQH